MILRKLDETNLKQEIAHGIYVSNLAYGVAKELTLKQTECYNLATAGLLHDVGKLRLYAEFNEQEENKLTIEQLRHVRQHPQLGYKIAAQHQYCGFICNSILYHHENYDGSGYPYNLQGQEIPVGARIIRLCDTFAALTADRPYRKAFDKKTAIELMIEEAKDFDLKVFLAFQRMIHRKEMEPFFQEEKI